MPFSVREGINIFLAGFVPTENLRFRDEELNFKLTTTTEETVDRERVAMCSYPAMTKTMRQADQKFILHVEPGSFTDSEILVMLGENGTGKTTLIRMLAGLLKSDEQAQAEEAGDVEGAHQYGVPHLNVSYKPQKISPKFQGTVRQLLHKKIREAYVHPQFVSDVMKPMSMDSILDNGVQNLSGGELQRVAIVMALGTPADLYLVPPPPPHRPLFAVFISLRLTSPPPIWTVSSVSRPPRSSRDTSSTPRRLPSWWSMTSSWPPT
jgi:ATP-binding cassette, sub-family E, member 1